MVRKIQVLICSILLFSTVQVYSQTSPEVENTPAPIEPKSKTPDKKKSKKITPVKKTTTKTTTKTTKKTEKSRTEVAKETVMKAKEEAKQKAEAAAATRAQTHQDESVVESTFIESNIMISEFFDGIAEGIDLFLAGQRLTKKENETAVKVSNFTYFVDQKPTDNATSVGVNLKLPNVEQFWSLKFTSYDETQERGVRRSQLRQTPRAQNYGASVGVFQKLGNVRASFEPRIQLANPVSISHSINFESVAEMQTYTINPKLEFFANADQGTGIFTAVNFHQTLSPVYNLTWVNEGEYEDKLHLFTVTNGLVLGHFLSRRSTVSYGAFLISKNQPNYHLSGYSLSVVYSKLIYKKILDWSLNPQLNFERTADFTGVPGLNIAINLNF